MSMNAQSAQNFDKFTLRSKAVSRDSEISSLKPQS